jgi:FixJ family two-component response regulator
VVAASVAPRGRKVATDREGNVTKRVANALAIHVKTVETHRAAVMEKLKL